ncbi:hypothetical protein HYY75_12385 [bacterium]|nr:hypothetical protein [bacterium]
MANEKPLQNQNKSKTSKNIERSIDELIGLAKGLIADGILNEEEVLFLVQWMNSNEHCRGTWPANKLFKRLDHMLIDSDVDESERKELLVFLRDISENSPECSKLVHPIPFEESQPQIIFFNRYFCLLGRFAFGPKKLLEAEIERRSGKVSDEVYMNTNYLIIGFLGNTDWRELPEGKMIKKALENRNLRIPIGSPISIVPEDHLLEALENSS